MTKPFMLSLLLVSSLLPQLLFAQGTTAAVARTAAANEVHSSGAPSLTIYNQDFAVVRQLLPLNMKAGMSEMTFADVTQAVEPDSVVLRDPAGKHQVQVIEQNYWAEPVNQQL